MRSQGLKQLSLVLLLLSLTACSGGSDSDTDIIGAESLYSPGASVGAVSYSQAYGIELLLLNEDGTSCLLNDGDYIEPGLRTLGVRIDPDSARIDRVLLSDGGVYQVKAGRVDDLYIAEFRVTQENLYQNVLVQVIHLGGLASKEKVVLRTFAHDYEDRFIKNSMGLIVGNDILSDLRESLAEMLDEMFHEAISDITGHSSGLITEIGYGDNDPFTTDVIIVSLNAEKNESYPGSVLHISLIIKDVYLSAGSLHGQSLVATSGNDLYVDCFAAIEDEAEGRGIRFILDFSDSAQVSFEHDFFLKDMVEKMFAAELKELELPCLVLDLSGLEDGMFTDLAGHISFYGKDVDLDMLCDAQDSELFDKFMFIDVYGIPQGADDGALSLGIGLHTVDYEEVIWERYVDSESGQADLEAGFDDFLKDLVDDEFEKMRQDYGALISNLSYG
ncbi:MAG TPA: hypothetical protein ENN05_02240, partial [Deltaproteobacteria bacterium]|nr:hypothetical protein [Deltaproteobacteria bacterium]